MAVVRIGPRNEVVIPKELREELGVKPGDFVEVILRPVADFPYTDELLGPEAKASIEAGLADIEAGRVYGPFDSAKELIRHLKTKPPESDIC